MRTPRYVLGMLATVLFAMNFASAALAPAGSRPFTVKDAIRVASPQEEHGTALHVSPDKKRFFLVETYGDLSDGNRVFTLKVFGSDGASPPPRTPRVLASATLRTSTNDDAIRLARWTADGRAVVFLGIDGEHPSQLYRLDVDDSSLIRLLPNSNQDMVAYDVRGDICVFVAKVGTPPTRPAGWALTDESMLQLLFPKEAAEFHEYALFVSRNHGAPRQISPASRSAILAYAGIGVSPDGRKVAVSWPPADVPKQWERYLTGGGAIPAGAPLVNVLQYQLIDLDTDRRRPLVDAPLGFATGDFSSPQVVWTKDGRSVFLSNTLQPLSEKAPPSKHSAVLKIDVGQPSRTPELVLASADFSPGERMTALHVDDEGARVNVETFVPAGERNSPQGGVGKHGMLRVERVPQGWHLAKKTAESEGGAETSEGRVWIAEDANHPPRLMIARENREPAELYDFNPWLSEVRLQPIRQITWRDKENHPWSGGIALPPRSNDGHKPPLIVALKFHDPTRFRPDGPYTTAFATQALVAKGFAVLELNSFDPAAEGTANEGPTQMRAIESAVDFAADTYQVDSNRVGLIGFSRTTFHVIYSLVNSQRRFAAATVSDGLDGGYVQYQLFTLNHFGGYVGNLFAKMQGGEPFGPGLDAWRRSAAMFNLDRVKTPLRVEMIGNSSVLQEWELYSSLKLLHKPVEAFWIPEGTHVLVKPRERYLSQQSTVEWFDYWINGAVSSEPLEPDQYRRWEALKQRPRD